MDVAYQAQTNIADSSREFQMQKASFDQEVNARKAEAELSYELQVKFLFVICQAVFQIRERSQVKNLTSAAN